MADTIRTLTAMLALLPDAISKERSQGPNDRARITNQILRDLLVSVNAWIITKNPKEAVIACTAAALPAYTYAAGVITANANGALAAIDGVTMVAGERLLLKDGAAGLDNGIYEVTQLGTAGTPFILTRTSDMAIGSDAAAAFMVVQEGTLHAEDRMLCTDDTGAAVVGTDALTFVTFQSTDMYAAAPENVAAAAVVGTSVLASPGNHVHAHGDLSNGAADYHDTDQVEDLSAFGAADLTTLLNMIPRRESVDLMTQAALAAYTRVTDVITADANGAIANIDGVAVVLNSRVLLNDGAAGADNGIYDVTDLGSAGTPFILTRASDMADGTDAAAAVVYVQRGTLAAGWSMVVPQTSGNAVVNTDALAWVPLHGDLSAIGAYNHDTDQVEPSALVVLPGVNLSEVINAVPRRRSASLMTVAALPAYTRVNDVITADANGAIPAIDGTAVVLHSRIILQSGAAPVDNGIYDVTDLGSAGTPFILTRSADMSDGSDASGASCYIEAGTQYNGTVVNIIEATGSAVVNTDGLTWVFEHGNLAAAYSHLHDTDQVDDLSVVGAADLTTLLDALISASYASTAKSQVPIETEMVSANGAVMTIAVYDISWTAAAQLGAAGLWDAVAAGNNIVICGAGLWAGGSYQLDGTDAVVITADGLSLNVALVACRCTSGIVLTAVFGDEAAFGTSLEPSPAEINAALDAALALTPAGPLAGLDTNSLVVWGRILVDRVAVNTINYTHTAPATDSDLMSERMNGQLGSLT